jgi:hypothetical protein
LDLILIYVLGALVMFAWLLTRAGPDDYARYQRMTRLQRGFFVALVFTMTLGLSAVWPIVLIIFGAFEIWWRLHTRR